MYTHTKCAVKRQLFLVIERTRYWATISMSSLYLCQFGISTAILSYFFPHRNSAMNWIYSLSLPLWSQTNISFLQNRFLQSAEYSFERYDSRYLSNTYSWNWRDKEKSNRLPNHIFFVVTIGDNIVERSIQKKLSKKKMKMTFLTPTRYTDSRT